MPEKSTPLSSANSKQNLASDIALTTRIVSRLYPYTHRRDWVINRAAIRIIDTLETRPLEESEAYAEALLIAHRIMSDTRESKVHNAATSLVYRVEFALGIR